MYFTLKMDNIPSIVRAISFTGLSSVALGLHIFFFADIPLHITHPDHPINIYEDLRKLEVGIENTMSGFLQSISFVPKKIFGPSELKRLKHFLIFKFDKFFSALLKCVELSLA